MSTATALLLACLTLLCIQVHDRLARARDERRLELIRESNAEHMAATARHAAEQHERQMEVLRETREINREWVEGQMKIEHPWGHGGAS